MNLCICDRDKIKRTSGDCQAFMYEHVKSTIFAVNDLGVDKNLKTIII